MNFKNKISDAEAVVFDLGAVILNINPQLSINQFNAFGVPDIFGFLFGLEQDGVFEEFERGKLNPQEFREHIRKRTGLKIDDQQFDHAFNAMLLDFPTARIDAVLRCGAAKPTFLLSNTNKIHYDNYSRRIAHRNIECLDDMFKAAYYSHNMGMRKPDNEIFENLIAKVGVSAQNILFIDDNLKNIESADKMGIQTIRICDGLDISEMF